MSTILLGRSLMTFRLRMFIRDRQDLVKLKTKKNQNKSHSWVNLQINFKINLQRQVIFLEFKKGQISRQIARQKSQEILTLILVRQARYLSGQHHLYPIQG